jgi:hypothetical protein
VPFRPRTCGQHHIVVVLGQGNGLTHGSATVDVTGNPGEGPDCPLTAVTSFTGNATRVGDSTAAPEVKIAGRFALAPTNGLDLTTARVTIQSLLTEAGGAGELVDRVAKGPVQLVARPGTRSTSGTFESSPVSGQPSFGMTLKRRPDGVSEFSLRVSRPVLSHRPLLCSADRPSLTPLVTRFVIDDGQHPPVEIATEQAWECAGGSPEVWRALRVR